MKRVVAAFVFFMFFFSGAAQAQEPVLGVYVGGKVGASLVNMKNRKFGMGTGGVEFDNVVYSWEDQSNGMGSKDDTVFGGGVTVGYDFDVRLKVPVRVELDYTLRDKASKGGQKATAWDFYADGVLLSETEPLGLKTSITLQTLMLNAWFDIPTGTMFSPYLGGGIGMAFIDYKATGWEIEDGVRGDTTHGSKDVTNFAWSLGGGVACDLPANWTLDLGYRYINAGKVTKTSFDMEGMGLYSKVGRVEAHDFMLGIRYTF